MPTEPWYIQPQCTAREKRAVVVGGGLAGTHAAYSLAKRGWKVVLLERSNVLADGASGNLFGILTPLITHKNDPIGEFYAQGFLHSLAHINKMVASYNSEILSIPCGVLELATSKRDKELRDIIPEGLASKVLSSQASLLCGINLNSNALYIEKACLVNPGGLCRVNIEAYSKNIEVVFAKNILSLKKCADGWAAVDVAGDEIASAPVVVIANAYDASIFIQSSFLPITKVRGQLTYLQGVNLNIGKILCYDGGYITPEIEGINYVGATYSRSNMSEQLCEDDHIENIKNLRNITDIGDINYRSLKGRVSFRASVIDRRPVIGAVPDIKAFYDDYADLKHGRHGKKYPAGKYLDGLYLSTGYGSRGLTACPIAGELLAAMINNEKLSLNNKIVNALSPARFLVKQLKAGL